ncbi:MAG TPA: sterol desaturase family protein [Candidatus Limnocylindria bacterium]|nr:sterol desaturase family protein [Candidatus Limnocylindria bacterium]
MTTPSTDSTQLGHWQTLRFGISVGWMIVLLTWEGVSPYLSFFASHRDRLVHASRNWLMAVFNSLLVASCFSAIWLWASHWSADHHFGLWRMFTFPVPFTAIASLLLLDLWTYAWHRLNHALPFLWRFHRMHHSDLHMDVSTANRFHFGEIAFSSVLRIPLILILGLDFWQLVVYETALQFVVQLHHANVTLPRGWETVLSMILVTPMIHKIHHSRVPAETDSNYASLFSFWDRLFGSFRRRESMEGIEYGLAGFDAENRQNIAGLLNTPRLPTRASE